MLEPVRKLPTNVGARIRKCINEALDRNPPEWARKILEHSISKEVYKGNASGPTKVILLYFLGFYKWCSLRNRQLTYFLAPDKDSIIACPESNLLNYLNAESSYFRPGRFKL